MWSFVGCFVGIFGVVVIGTAPDPVTTGPLASLVGTLSVADPVGAFVGTSTPPEVTTGSAVVTPLPPSLVTPVVTPLPLSPVTSVTVPGLTGTFIGVVLPGLFVGTCIDVPVPETASVTDPEEDVDCEPLSIVGAIVGCVTSDVLVFPVPGSSVVIVPASVVLVPDIAEVVPPVVTCPHVSGPEPQGTGTAEVLVLETFSVVPETFSVVLTFPAPEVVTSTLAVGVPEPLSGVVELSDPDPLLSVTGAADDGALVGTPGVWSVMFTPGVMSVTDAPEVVIFESVPLSVTTPPDVVMSTLGVLLPSTGSAVVMFVSTGASVVTDPDPLSGVVELLSVFVPFPDVPEPLSVVWDGDSVVVSFPVIDGTVVLVTSSVELSVLGAGASVVACGVCVVTASVVGLGFSVGFSVTQWHSWDG